MRDRQAKKRKKMNPARLVLTGVVLVILIVFAVSVKNVIDLRQEQANLKETNEDLKAQKAALEQELKSVNDKNYIEEQARMQLKLIKPGEVLYILDEEEEEAPAAEDAEDSQKEDSAE